MEKTKRFRKFETQLRKCARKGRDRERGWEKIEEGADRGREKIGEREK
jgi:hypothetical protein